MDALTYDQMLDRWDLAKSRGEKRNLRDYSAYLNDLYDTQAFTEGLRDGPWTQASHRLDRYLQQSPVGDLLGGVGGAVGGMFGHGQEGEHVGRGLPRMLLDTAPLLIGAAAAPFTGGASLIPAVAGAVGTGLLMGGHTYADTGSAKAGLISGGLGALLPAFGKVGGGVAARLGADAFGQWAGHEAAGVATNLASMYGVDRAMGGDTSLLDLATSPEFLLQQIPFTVYGAVHAATTKPVIRPPLPPKVKQVQQFVPQGGTDEQKAQAAAYMTRVKMATTANEAGEVDQAVVSAALGDLIKVTTGTEAAPVAPAEEASFTITGRWNRAGNAGYRVLVEAVSDPTMEALVGKTIWRNEEPTGGLGNQFTIKASEVNQQLIAKRGLTPQDFGVPKAGSETQQPELPVQPPPGEGRLGEVEQLATESGERLAKLNELRAKKYPLSTQVEPAKPEYGTKNTLFTADRAEAARKRLEARLGRTNVGLDPTILADLVEVGGFHVEAGLRTFAAWSKQMVQEFGALSQEHLQEVWKTLKGTLVGRQMQVEGEGETKLLPQEIATVADMGVPEHRVAQLVNTVEKFGNPALSMLQGRIHEDPSGRVVGLGGRQISGAPMTEAEFQSRTKVSPGMFPLYRAHYPEAFTADGKVDATALVKGLRERPLTEVMKAGEGTEKKRSLQDVRHDLDIQGYVLRIEQASGEVVGLSSTVGIKPRPIISPDTPEFAALPERVRKLYEESKTAKDSKQLSYSGNYSISSNPKGGVEIAVVATGPELVIGDHAHNLPNLLGTATVEEKTLGELRATMGKDHPKLARFEGKPDDAVIGVQTEAQSDWEGDTRSEREETLENEPKHLAADEDSFKQAKKFQQETGGALVWPKEIDRGDHDAWRAADWATYMSEGEAKRKTQDFIARIEERIKASKAKIEAAQNVVPAHPLLPYWERLVADAVIQHGLERGWEGVVVTDAKTAAMTEGHDQHEEHNFPVDENGHPTEKVTVATDKLGEDEGFKEGQARLAKQYLPKELQGQKPYSNETWEYTLPNGNRERWYIGWIDNASKLGVEKWTIYVDKGPVKQFPGHAQHYGDPDFRIGPQQMPGSLQQEFAKATGERNTILDRQLTTKSNFQLPKQGIETGRVGKTHGLFYGTSVKGEKARRVVLPTQGKDILILRDRRLENTGDAGNAPVAELFDAGLLTIDSDLKALVEGKEGMEQPLDTDLLTAIQLKRDGFNVIHLVDPVRESNVVSIDLRHVTEQELTNKLKARISEADTHIAKDGPNELEKFETDNWILRQNGGENVLAVGVHKGAEQVAGETTRNFDSKEEAEQYATTLSGHVAIKPSADGTMWWVSSDEGQTKGSPSLTEPHPITGVVGPKVYATGNYYSFDRIRGGLSLDDTLSIKEAVARFDQAQGRETRARELAAQRLEELRPEVLAQLAKEFPPEELARRWNEGKAAGLDDNTILQSLHLRKQVEEIDAALLDKNLAVVTTKKTLAKNEALLESQQLAEQQAAVQTELSALDEMDKEGRKLSREQQDRQTELLVQRDNIRNRLNQLAYKLGRTDPHEVQSTYMGQGQREYEPVLGPTGERAGGFKTVGDAQEWINAHPQLDPNEIVIRDAGRSSPGRPHRGYYLAKPINRGLSLEAENEQGGSLGDILAEVSHSDEGLEAFASSELEQQALADTSNEIVVEQMRELHEQAFDLQIKLSGDNLEVFSSKLDASPEVAKRMLDATKVVWRQMEEGKPLNLKQLNDALPPGVPKFIDLQEAKEVMAEVQRAMLGMTREFSAKTLGSQVPHNAELVRAIGLEDLSKGVQPFVQWAAGRTELGYLGDFFQMMAQFPKVLARVALRLAPGGGFTHSYDPYTRRSLIELDHLPSKENFSRWLQNMGHEFLHVFDSEIGLRNDPAAQEFRKSRSELLDVMRKSEHIPVEVRRLVTLAVKEGHLELLAKNGEVPASWKKILGAKYQEYFPMAYALLNEREFVASMANSPALVRAMLATKAPVKTGLPSVLQWLSKMWNKVWGGKPQMDTVFAQLLSSYDNYLSGGLRRRSYNGVDYARHLLVSAGTRPEALASRLATIRSLYSTGDVGHSVEGFLRESNADILPPGVPRGELRPEFVSAVGEAETRGLREATENLLLSELEAHKAAYARLREDVGIVAHLDEAQRAGKLPAEASPLLRKNLKSLGSKLVAMREGFAAQDRALGHLQAVGMMEPDEFYAQVGQMSAKEYAPRASDTPEVEETRARLGLARALGKGMNPLTWFQNTMFVRDTIPGFKNIYDRVSQMWYNASARFDQIMVAGLRDPNTGQLSNTIQSSNRRVAKSDSLSKAVSELMLWQTKNGRTLDESDAKVKEILSRVGNDKEAVLQKVRSEAQLTQQTNTSYITFLHDANKMQLASFVVAREPGMLPETGERLAGQVYQAVGLLADPRTMQQGVAQMEVLKTQVSPGTFVAAMQLAQKNFTSATELGTKLLSMPWQASERRLGKWQVVWQTPDGKPGRTSYDSESEMTKDVKKLVGQGWQVTDSMKSDEANLARNELHPDIYAAFSEFDQQTVQAMDFALAETPELAARIMPAVKEIADTQRGLAAEGLLPGVTRRFVAGREFIDMAQNQQRYRVRLNNMMRNRGARLMAELHMMHPDVAGNREVANLSKQFITNLLTPDDPSVRKWVEATYLFRLGGDLGQGLIESWQTLFTGMPELIKATGYVGDASVALAKAMKNVVAHKVFGKPLDPWQAYAMNRLAEEGLGGRIMWDDVYDPETESVRNANYRKQGPFATAATTVTGAARNFSRFFQKWNDYVMLLAGLDVAKQSGITEISDAYVFARELKAKANFNPGKVGRALAPWNIKTKAVPQLMNALQSYTVGWFSQLADSYKKGWGGAAKDLTERERVGARKAFAYSLIAQATVAGALGLPGMGQGLALFSQATGIDAKSWIRANLGKLLDEDEAYGGFGTNFAMHGIAAAGLPLDPSSRLSISVPFIGVDSYKGFQPSNLLGAPLNTVSDFVKGVVSAAKGDSEGAVKALPNFAKRPTLLALHGGDIRDQRGALLHELSPGAQFAMAIGLQSSKAQGARDTAQAVKSANEAAQRQKESLADEIAKQVRSGDVAGAQRRFAEVVHQSPKLLPDANAFVKTIASRTRAQIQPYDWRREVNPGAELAGLGAAGMPANELQGIQIENAVMRMFGVRTRPNPRAEFQAAQTDALLNSDPFLTRSGARKVLRKPRAVHANTLLDTPMSQLGYQ